MEPIEGAILTLVGTVSAIAGFIPLFMLQSGKVFRVSNGLLKAVSIAGFLAYALCVGDIIMHVMG